MLDMPNLAHASVPVGKSEPTTSRCAVGHAARVRLRAEGPHRSRRRLRLIDFATAAKLSGARFSLLRGGVARLHRALAQFMLDTHTREHGYVECYTPYIVNAATLLGHGPAAQVRAGHVLGHQGVGARNCRAAVPDLDLGDHADQPVRDEIVPLPTCRSSSPRIRRASARKAGSYGKDTRGMIRQHQFDKVELGLGHASGPVVRSARAADAHAETILQRLDLPYRVMTLCTGDMGFGSAKTYDLEVWLPGQNAYREISSCSNCEAFQARRMQARFRNAQGKTELVHTLNGSGSQWAGR
jgi:seryl-tRNA synthetase